MGLGSGVMVGDRCGNMEGVVVGMMVGRCDGIGCDNGRV